MKPRHIARELACDEGVVALATAVRGMAQAPWLLALLQQVRGRATWSVRAPGGVRDDLGAVPARGGARGRALDATLIRASRSGATHSAS